MATRAEEERRQDERGERFIKIMAEQFATTRSDIRSDMEQKFVPRPEAEMYWEHADTAIERVATTVDKLATTVQTFHESVPHTYAQREDQQRDISELRVEIEKLKTALDAFKERSYGARFEDQGKRYEGDERTDRGWRTAQQQHITLTNGQLITALFALLALVVPVIVLLATRKP